MVAPSVEWHYINSVVGRLNQCRVTQMKTIQQQGYIGGVNNTGVPAVRRTECSGSYTPSSRHGFTLLEIMIAVTLFGLVVAGTIEVYIMCNKLWHITSLNMQTVRESNLAISRIVYGMGTNNGLRSAATVTLNTNLHGHWDGVRYWETGAQPLPASSAMQYLCGEEGNDGSWRLSYSNDFGGLKHIDYNIQERSLLFLPESGAIATRLLICNYVNAQVTTNLGGTISIELTVQKRDGNFVSSNTVNTLVKIRNHP